MLLAHPTPPHPLNPMKDIETCKTLVRFSTRRLKHGDGVVLEKRELPERCFSRTSMGMRTRKYDDVSDGFIGSYVLFPSILDMKFYNPAGVISTVPCVTNLRPMLVCPTVTVMIPEFVTLVTSLEP